MKRHYLTILCVLVMFIAGCIETNGVEPSEPVDEPPADDGTDETVTPEEEPEEEVPVDEDLAPPDEEVVEQDPNLIAHWKFDEEGGSTVLDSANEHHGTIHGNAARAEGKSGKALFFDGVDDYVDFSQNTVNEIGGLEQGTIAFWFNYESILETQTVMPIFYIGVSEKDPDDIFVIEIGHFNEETFTMEPDPSNKKLYVTWMKDDREPFLCYDSDFNLEENEWHHFAVVVGPEGNTGYLNGIELINRDYTFGESNDQSFLDDIHNEEKVMLGHGRSSSMVSPDFAYYKGYLDDFRIYDRPLSSSEINEIMNN